MAISDFYIDEDHYDYPIDLEVRLSLTTEVACDFWGDVQDHVFSIGDPSLRMFAQKSPDQNQISLLKPVLRAALDRACNNRLSKNLHAKHGNDSYSTYLVCLTIYVFMTLLILHNNIFSVVVELLIYMQNPK